MSVYSTLFSQTFFGLLFCYLTITDVTMYLQIIDFQFPSCCTSQPKKTKPNHYCEQFYEYSYHQKNNSCTLCVPMFFIRRAGGPTSFPGSLFSASIGRWNKDPGCGWSCDHPESGWQKNLLDRRGGRVFCLLM